MDGDARRGRREPNLEDILGMKEQVPEPCRTCGRPELPERLHSHPRQPGAAVNHHGYGHLPLPRPAQPAQPAAPPDVAPVKNTVKKPVPIKYRPRRSSEDGRTRSPAAPAAPRKASLQILHSPPYFADADGGPVSPSRGGGGGGGGGGGRGPRTVTCYVCGRDFGTASLPLHEPQCVQRWWQQNSKLPPQWQRQLPDKPKGPITVDDWNKFAWEASKGADSVQCPNCLRRFCPDRIISHERVCFKKQNTVAGEPPGRQAGAPAGAAGGAAGGAVAGTAAAGAGSARSSARNSPLVECHLCGKKFGTRSIGIHEPQCLRKQVNAEHTPTAILDKPRECPQIKGPPVESKPLAIEFKWTAPAPAPAPAITTAPNPQARPRAAAAVKSAWAGEEGILREAATAAPATAPAPAAPAAPRKQGKVRGRPLHCYLCGRMFSLQSLSIHEPQCLIKWRLENSKLPPDLQRPEPDKPEIIFTEDGDVDYWKTFDRIWANHTESLIPCRSCGRRFFPDRIQIHEHACVNSHTRR